MHNAQSRQPTQLLSSRHMSEFLLDAINTNLDMFWKREELSASLPTASQKSLACENRTIQPQIN